MSKIKQDFLKQTIHELLQSKKKRNFSEAIELQVVLRDYDPDQDKRFVGNIQLPHCPNPNLRVLVMGSLVHCEQAKNAGIPYIDAEGLKKFNKNKKLIIKFFRQYDAILASETFMRQIPRLLGPCLSRISKFPQVLLENEQVKDKVQEVRSKVKWQLRKTLCLGNRIGSDQFSEEQIRQNLVMSINFLISLLKKGWFNIKSLHLKSSMSKSYKIYQG